MPNKPPALIAWDTCCILGLFNKESDKLAGLTYELRECDEGRAFLGIASATLSEVTRLADGSAAYPHLETFLQFPFVQQLNSTGEVGLLASKLGHRFDLRSQPELLAKATASGCPRDQNRLKPKDAEILATAIVYKATQLTTYDPLLLFLGAEFIRSEFGLIIDKPASGLLFLS
jgi:predicted nucleic acid-binding protein